MVVHATDRSDGEGVVDATIEAVVGSLVHLAVVVAEFGLCGIEPPAVYAELEESLVHVPPEDITRFGMEGVVNLGLLGVGLEVKQQVFVFQFLVDVGLVAEVGPH